VAQKLHRRSRSSEAVWLDHRPEDTVDTGALLRPCMKTSKSVAKLSDKDIRSGSATDYVLTHQDIDSDGDFETQLIKVRFIICYNFVITVSRINHAVSLSCGL
jgi:Arf6-interacting domain of mitotic kinesin-like protein 1